MFKGVDAHTLVRNAQGLMCACLDILCMVHICELQAHLQGWVLDPSVKLLSNGIPLCIYAGTLTKILRFT